MKLYNRLWGLVVGGGLIIISYHDELLSFASQAKEKGITWGLIVPLWIAANRIYKGRMFERRDARWEAYFQAIGKAVGAEWDAEKSKLKPSTGLLRSKSSPKGTSPAPITTSFTRLAEIVKSTLSRRINMQKINWVTLIPALMGAIKLILQPFGIDMTAFTDENVNAIANGVAALAAIIGILSTNRKAPKETDDTKVYSLKGGKKDEEYYGDHGSMV